MKIKLFVILFMLSALVLMGQSITVTSPNGGESWAEGSSHNITWNTTGITSGHFRIFLFDGATELGTIATYIPVSGSTYSVSWTVGHLTDATDVGAGTNYKIKIRVISEAPNDFSDAAFSITSTAPPAGSIAVTSPNGGENWEQGSNHNITWTPTGITSGTYRITLLKGGVPAGIVASGLPLSQHSYSWTVGNTDSPFQGAAANYRIQVENVGGTALDFSNNAFVISEPPETPADTITVTSPSGGSWVKGSNHTITWTSPGITSGNYQITLRKGSSSFGVIATGIAASIHSYLWKVGDLTGLHPFVNVGSDYKIRVQLIGESIYDDSAPFSITIRFFPPWLEKLKQYERFRFPWWIDPPGPDPDPWDEHITFPVEKIRGLIGNARNNPVKVGLVRNGELLGILGQFKGSQFTPGNMAKLTGKNGLRLKLGRGQRARISQGGDFTLRFINAKTGEVMYNMKIQMEQQNIRRSLRKIQR